MTAVAQTLVTADDLDRVSREDGVFEVVNGELVEVPSVGNYETLLEVELIVALKEYVSAKVPGILLPGRARFRLKRDPDLVRGPDVSFTSRERLPEAPFEKGYFDLAPDLAVEIVSASNPSSYTEQKVSEYLDADVRMVWVIYPDTRTAYLYTSKDSVRRIDENGELDGGEAVPGFKMRLGDLFDAAGT